MSTDVLQQIGSPTRRNVTWRISQFFFVAFITVWLRPRVRNLQNVPTSGAGLVVGNHQSFLDPMLFAAYLQRPISYLARDSLFKVPILGWFLRQTYVMPINRAAATTAVMRQTIARLNAGFLCGIFPEGTRSADGNVDLFKPGFVALVRKTDVPILPVGIAGANRALGRGSWFIKPATVSIVYGEPILPEVIHAQLAQGDDRAFVDFVRQRVIACQQEAEACLRK